MIRKKTNSLSKRKKPLVRKKAEVQKGAFFGEQKIKIGGGSYTQRI